MAARKYILPFLFLFGAQFSLQGQFIELRGKVVEVTDGRAKGVPNVTVKVIGESVDVTKVDGSFKLNIPSGKESVTIILENSPHPMIDPYAGRVNVPPPGDLQIRVCAAENEKLRTKLGELNTRIGQLERQRQLSSRQIEQMHRTLLDTILFYETQVINLTQALGEKDAQLAEKKQEIIDLERKVASLEQQLFKALEEKYLRQQQTYKAVAEGLNAYRSRLKDVQRELARVSDCFLHPQGCDNLYAAVRKYSDARNAIDETHNANVEAVGHYWESRSLPSQLEETYGYILKSIHEPVMLGTVNGQVLDPIKDYANKQKGRMAAKKEAERGAADAMQSLGPMVMELDVKIDAILRSLSETI